MRSDRQEATSFMRSCPTACDLKGDTPMAIRPSMRRQSRVGLAGLLFFSLALLAPPTLSPAGAQGRAIIERGDAAVTGFSGAKANETIPDGVHPTDLTFIDPEGASLRVFDLSRLGSPPSGQLADAPVRFAAKAAEIGQVFAVTLDGEGKDHTPDILVGATARYGLHIVAKDSAGGYERLLKGAPNAEWMPGLFGLARGGGPGSIYRIDGRSGAISLLATLASAGKPNAGPGVGALAVDSRTRTIYASDLESGLVHRLAPDGRVLAAFDHGTTGRRALGLEPVADDPSRRMSITDPAFDSENPATWGFADPVRQVTALAVHRNRLYYAAEATKVFSVGLAPDGAFGSDVRLELDVVDTAGINAITDIELDGQATMILTQRGEQVGSYDYTELATPGQSLVLRYAWQADKGQWSPEPGEYAIGLKPEHRSTEGGVALGYGYDKAGNIDYGACRRTLWTTGGELRSGEDIQRVRSGGASIVNGLQGNPKSLLRPKNEPPYTSWFVDYDGTFEDPDARGHMGGIDIFDPCEPKPGVPEQAEFVPEKPGIALEKQCFADVIGGPARCRISVRNDTTVIPTEDIVFVDSTTVLVGPGAGTIIEVASTDFDGDGWSCALTDTLDLTCSLTASLLTPGTLRWVDVWIDTGAIITGGNFGFRNCVSIDHPLGVGRVCSEGTPNIVVEKTGPAECLPGGECTFGLTLTNTGTEPFEGDVLLADNMLIGGAGAGAPITSIVPPLGCAVEPVALPFSCVAPVSLAPGESRTHSVTVTMPAPGGYTAENCFAAVDPALVADPDLVAELIAAGLVPAGGFTSNGYMSCVPVVVPDVPLANLRIEKAPVGAGQCVKVGLTLQCDYQITITNTGAADFNDVIEISESVQPLAVLQFDAAWACIGGPPDYTCASPGPVALAPGASIVLTARVDVDVNQTEANFCEVPNTVAISYPPGGSAGNSDAGDDNAVANAWTTGIAWVDPAGVTHVLCDPTNLKTEKVSKGPCVQSGNGWRCDFTVTVTNTGPDPYSGPITVEDTFATAPQSVSFSAPWTCAGGGASHTCKHPVVALPKGDSVTLEVSAIVPDSGRCSIKNTATMAFPAVGSKGNGKGSDDTASASAKIPSPKCDKPDRVVEIPTPLCQDGRKPRPDGSCPCPRSKPYNPETGRCEHPTPDPVCEPGWVTYPGPNYVPAGWTWKHWSSDGARLVCALPLPPPTIHCPSGWTEFPGARYVPHGWRWKRIVANGQSIVCGWPVIEVCVPRHNEVVDLRGRCVCREGTVRDNYGRCVPRVPPETCLGGISYVHAPTGQRICRCPDGMLGTPPNCYRRPVDPCRDGTHYSALKRACIPDRPVCLGNTHWNPKTQRCESGHRPPACLGNTVWNPNTQRCERPGGVCPRNKVWNPSTQSCERPGEVGQPGGKCPPNTHFNPKLNTCVRDGGPSTGPGGGARPCPDGFVRTPNGCVQRPDGSRPCPQQGFVRDSAGKCVRPGGESTVPPPRDPCPKGKVRNPLGACVEPGSIGSSGPIGPGGGQGPCRQGFTRNAKGLCVPEHGGEQPCLRKGFVRNAAGKCVDPDASVGPTGPAAGAGSGQCGPGMHRNPKGVCVPDGNRQPCGPGMVRAADGSCKPIKPIKPETVKPIKPEQVKPIKPEQVKPIKPQPPQIKKQVPRKQQAQPQKNVQPVIKPVKPKPQKPQAQGANAAQKQQVKKKKSQPN